MNPYKGNLTPETLRLMRDQDADERDAELEFWRRAAWICLVVAIAALVML